MALDDVVGDAAAQMAAPIAQASGEPVDAILKQGIVTAVNQSTKTVTVKLIPSNTEIAGVAFLGSYTPNPPNDTVWMIQNGPDLLVIGSQQNSATEGSPPTGSIFMWPTADPPAGYVPCDGGSTSPYAELAALIGANVPDLRDRFIVCVGSTYAIGNTGGANTVVLTEAQLAVHNHSAAGTNFVMTGASGTTYEIAIGGGGGYQFHPDGATATKGSNQAHENRPPYYALLFIIKV